MPRYFFDVDDGSGRFDDQIGMTLPGLDAVEAEVAALLEDIVRDRMPDGEHVMKVSVRDDRGAIVYVGEMKVVGRRLGR